MRPTTTAGAGERATTCMKWAAAAAGGSVALIHKAESREGGRFRSLRLPSAPAKRSGGEREMRAITALEIPPLACMAAARFSCLIFLLLLSSGGLFHNAVLADEIFTSPSEGVTFGRSSREPKYKIEFHSAKSPFHPENDQESVVVTNREGRNYMCFLPTVEETKFVKSIAQQNSSSIILEADRKAKFKTPDELIDVLKGKCFYRHEGWWSYEFCHQKHLRQLHLDDGTAVQEFVLGVFDPEETSAFNQDHSETSLLKDPRSKDASQRYHAHRYTNGTSCDLTNQPRETEVRFVCSEPTIIISSIKEISTCKYVVMVQCPLLCKHPMFQQERPVSHTINCNEMPGDTAEDGVKGGTQITVVADEPIDNLISDLFER